MLLWRARGKEWLSHPTDAAHFAPQVLFGTLLRGDRGQQRSAGQAPPGGSSMPTDSNILRMAPVGPRFSYLPVTTPVALLRQSSLQQHQLPAANGTAAAEQTLGGVPVARTGSEVSASAYSFATLLSDGGSRAGGRSGEGGEGTISSGAASAAVGSGMGKLVGSLQGLIGIGDTTLGDMSSSSLLSSFARFKQ